MTRAKSPRLSVARSAWQWWKDIAAREGRFPATKKLLVTLLEFVRDSTPQRRRSRYGDADYDWEHRVNTTAGAVGWRDRLLGVFHSPYQPTEAALFHEMLQLLREHLHSSLHDFTFIDLGSGKGRTLLMAADYPFRRIIGVELLPTLNEIAQENIARHKAETQRCFAMQSICGDATEFEFPAEPTVLYLFNPFPEAGLRRLISNLERSSWNDPRPFYVLYHNPLLAHVLEGSATIRRVVGTHQFTIYAAAISEAPSANSRAVSNNL
jgi:SAM-dependent methyltransferase